MIENSTMKCCVCGKKLTESWSFGGYGNTEAEFEKLNHKEYCKKHFDERYFEIFGNNGLEEPDLGNAE